MTKRQEYFVKRGRMKSTIMCRDSLGREHEVMRLFSHYVAVQVANALGKAFHDGLYWPPTRAK